MSVMTRMAVIGVDLPLVGCVIEPPSTTGEPYTRRDAGRIAAMTTLRAAAVLALFGLAAAACGSAATSGAPASPTLAPRPSVPPSLTGSTPSATSQTDTEWGRIWDTLPSTFPTVSGSAAGEET